MTWWGWLIFAVNLLGFVIAWRWTAYAISHEFGDNPGGDEIIMGLFIGGLLSIPWPLTILYHLGGANRAGGFVMSAPPRVRREQKRREMEQQIREQQYRIRELERETGIGSR